MTAKPKTGSKVKGIVAATFGNGTLTFSNLDFIMSNIKFRLLISEGEKSLVPLGIEGFCMIVKV